jgi:hypothetical protein
MASVRTAPASASFGAMRGSAADTRSESDRASQRMPLSAKLAMLSLLTPAYFMFGTLLMTPSRLFFMVALPFWLVRLFSGKVGRVNFVDWLILFHVFWFSLSVAVNKPAAAVTFAGSNSIIILGGYLAARTSIRNIDQFYGFIRFFTGILLISVPFVLYEALSQHLTIPYFIEMLGMRSNKDVEYPLRMGLDRVQFVFAHPIHFGIFASLSVGLFFVAMQRQVGTFRLWAQTLVLALVTFSSLSSGPLLSMVIQMLIILWSYVTRKLVNRWQILIWGLFILYVVLELASNGPVLYYLISRLTFSGATANYRRILLNYGMAQVWRTPIFGAYGVRWDLPPWMSGSLDNYWLGLAVQYGIPTFLSQFVAFVGAINVIGRKATPAKSRFADARFAWSTSIVSASLALGTVYIWNEIASFVFFFFGAGIWMIDAKSNEDEGHAVPKTEDRRGVSYSRFTEERQRQPNEGRPPTRR